MSKNLQPGMTIPDFELPDEAGDMHRLSDLQGDNVLVLHLSRGEHCPRERLHHCASTSSARSRSRSW
jgi:peroxiredoxin